MESLTVFGLDIPQDVHALESFRNWVAELGEDSPRVHYWQGRVSIEMSPQHYRSHAPIVAEINRVLLNLCLELNLGRYYLPPSWITHEASALSTEPDGFLVLWETLRSGAARINPQRPTEMLGRPDMRLEVVSQTSATKDLRDLVQAYAVAGVREYWTVDARAGTPVLEIRSLDADGRYGPSQSPQDGWTMSPIWGRQFRLVAVLDAVGQPDFRLELRRT